MPQCKMANCREPALPTGKRYCAEHKAAYLRKQKEYEAVRATLRQCGCCGDRLTLTRHERGESLCSPCSVLEAHRERQQAIFNEKEALRRRRLEDLHSAKTVEELRGWIKEHVLPFMNGGNV